MYGSVAHLLVVMSEGVFNTLSWAEIENALSTNAPVQILAEEIIGRVNNSPKVNKDNATILICRQV